jgi:hypothetical protein
MPSVTDLANLAIARVKGRRITSLTDGSNNANRFNDVYPSFRDALLRSHYWNFALTRVELARSATAPAFGYQYGYTLPSDWLRTLSAHNNDGGFGGLDYREGTIGAERVIEADAENVYLRYIRRITDPNKWNPDFYDALAYGIARDLALPVAGSNTLRETMNDAHNAALGRAKGSDSQDSPPEKPPPGSWVTARFGWR